MANQYVNKVAVNGKTVLDLSGDTVYPGMLAKGITAHDKSGAKITGTLTVPGQETRNVELNMKSGNQAIVASTGMLMKQVTVVKPGTFLPENIKKGVNIGGVIGTLEASPSGGGSSSETWVLNNEAYLSTTESVAINVNFTSNGLSFSSIMVSINLRRQILYDSTVVKAFDAWTSQAYRKLTFDAPPTGDLLTWLQANGVKQANDTAVQPSKDVSITANGTTTITPDAPYDALKKVDVTVDVASGGGGAGFSVTFPATAANWDMMGDGLLLLADGTTKSIRDYSAISGQTIKNVVGIEGPSASTSAFDVLKMVLSEGAIAQRFTAGGQHQSYYVTTSPNATKTPYGAGKSMFWWPIADTVISSIEMYNTD